MRLILFVPVLFCFTGVGAQNVGIGTTSPQARLHLKSDFEVLRLQGSSHYISFYDNAGSYNGYLWNRNNNAMDLGTPAGSNFPIYISPNTVTSAVFHPNGNLGLGVTDPGFRLDVLGRIRLRHSGATAGIWFGNSTNTTSPGFVGLFDDSQVGMYGSGAGWMMRLNTNTGDASFTSTVTASDYRYNSPRSFSYTVTSYDVSAADGYHPSPNPTDYFWSPDFTHSIYRGFTTAVHLPDGAQLTSISAPAYDNSSASDLLVLFEAQSNTSSAATSLAVLSSSATPGYTTLSASLSSTAPVNNAMNSYVLYITATPNWTNDQLRIRSVVISYTLPGPQ